MTPEEKPFDTSRIPVFYQNGSVKVGDKEYAPGEYPLGTDTTMTDVDASKRARPQLEVIHDQSNQQIILRAIGHYDLITLDVSDMSFKDAGHKASTLAYWIESGHDYDALAAERDELERLAGDAAEMIKLEVRMWDNEPEIKALVERLTAYQRKNKGEGNG